MLEILIYRKYNRLNAQYKENNFSITHRQTAKSQNNLENSKKKMPLYAEKQSPKS